jgi:hypothetical protein
VSHPSSRPLDAADIALLKDLRARGASFEQVAVKADVSVATIRRLEVGQAATRAVVAQVHQAVRTLDRTTPKAAPAEAPAASSESAS